MDTRSPLTARRSAAALRRRERVITALIALGFAAYVTGLIAFAHTLLGMVALAVLGIAVATVVLWKTRVRS